jgi:hypothetical protein
MKKYQLILLLFFLILIFFFGARYYAETRIERIKKTSPKYVYENYSGVANSVLFITRLKYREDYVLYYSKMKNGENPTFNFPLKTMPQNDPVYILTYSKDSVLVKIVSFYDRGPKFGGSYNEGYVLREFLHDTPPKD